MLWRKLCLLIWKNFLIQCRHPWQTLLEIVVPVLCTSMLILLRSLVAVTDYPDEWHFPPVRLDTLDALRGSMTTTTEHSLDFRLAYSPQNAALDQLIADVAADMQLDGHVATANATELERQLLANNYLAGIEFALDPEMTNSSLLPHVLSYALRFPGELRTHHQLNPLLFNWQTDKSITPNQEPGPRTRYSPDGGIPPGYRREGFLALQHAIARRFLHAHAAANGASGEMPEVVIQRFPHPPFRMDMLINGLEMILPVILVVAYIYPCITITKVIALEKERQLKESMQIMGLPGWLHWVGWTVRALPPLVASSALIVVVLKVHWSADSAAVLTFTDWSVLLVFLLVYSVTTVAYCAMMSVFFSRANVAAAIAGVVWFALYLVYQFVDADQLQLHVLLLLCLFSNTGMALGVMLVLRFEASGNGSQWSNLLQPYSVDNDLTVGHVMAMLVATALVYALIALYVEQIAPGEFGVPRPWYFPVQRSYWRRATRKLDTLPLRPEDELNHEPVHTDRQRGVEIRNLYKVYGSTIAVQQLTMALYTDQITVLLGHNGAGKTTTMSMLTGMITPTSGTALVNGYDIRAEINSVRSSLGLCPQHNILFDDLTVREHLEFFTRLKGIAAGEDVRSEADKYLQLIGLEEKADTRSAALSGGMKRKLAVCIAFCGGSKVVFCDEPSSGMDPAARRSLWEFIRREKRGRTVLLSTHFMDEADVLGDRIAILNAGELKCCGSPYFLKKRFGVGYHLVCTINGDTVQTQQLYNKLLTLNAGVELKHESHTELSFRLPDAMQESFEALFRHLEDNMNVYGLRSFGVSLTTLEDVFMNVGSDRIAETATSDERRGNKMATVSMNTLTSDIEYDAVVMIGARLWLSQICALIGKRYLQTIRSWPLLLVQIAIPALFVVATILIDRSNRQFANLPRLPIELSMYDSTVTLLQNHSAQTIASNLTARFDHEYTQLVRSAGNQGEHALQTIAVNMADYVLQLSEESLFTVNREYYVGTHLADNGSLITAWFNNQPYHAVPLSLSLVHTALIRAQLDRSYAIHVTNAPLPYNSNTLVQLVLLAGRMGLTLGLNVAFSMSFVMAFFVLHIVREQANRAKNLQFVSGAKVLVYWGTAWLWDYLLLAAISVLLVIVFVAFQESGWSSADELARFLLCLLAFGYAALPVSYLCGRGFRVPTAAFTVLTIGYLCAGVVLPITVQSLQQYQQHGIGDAMTWAFQVLPHYALNTCLRYMQEITQHQRICQVMCEAQTGCTPIVMCQLNSTCCDFRYFTMSQPGMGTPLLYLLVTGTIVMSVNLMIELRWMESLFFAAGSVVRGKRDARRLATIDLSQSQDDDVLEEKHRVQTMSKYEVESQRLVLKNVTKDYGHFRAVNELSVAVDSSECFGLLGINGAGKTSTFQMLTGDQRISSGEAWLRGIPLRTAMTAAHRHIGYCPQFDALIEEMTPRETLHMFSRLRGIPPARIESVVTALAFELNFAGHLDKQVRRCSGGNRRKLSTALALLGRPAVVFLDEPTTGMDPGAKRHVWNVLTRLRREWGTAIVLTSHSMDECEALSTRLAIMVNGEFRCLGSVQHLKSRFARGYALAIRVRDGAATPQVAQFVQHSFAGAVLQNEIHGLLSFYVPSDTAHKWSTMFGVLNRAKERLSIADYTLSQTTLEQVFLSFADQMAVQRKPPETSSAAGNDNAGMIPDN